MLHVNVFYISVGGNTGISEYPTRSTTMKLATAGKAFGFWNNKDNTFQFKLPPGTCKAEIPFIGCNWHP